MTSCQGARVSGNGFLDTRNEVLNEALIGDWETSGEEGVLVQFSETGKELTLKINDEERPMFDFNSDGGIRFSFGYLNEVNDTVFVAAQFKAYNMETLVYLESPQEESSLDIGFLRLDRKISTKVEGQQ